MADTDALVDAQYVGAKAALRSIYDAVIAAVMQFGHDVEIAPKKGYVSLRRGKQFAILQPSTTRRVDIGINLQDVAPTGRLEASRHLSAALSHWIRVSRVDEVDQELVGWLKKAYEEL